MGFQKLKRHFVTQILEVLFFNIFLKFSPIGRPLLDLGVTKFGMNGFQLKVNH